MTTLCLCDFVDVDADRERLPAPTRVTATSSRTAVVPTTTHFAPHLLPRLAATLTSQDYLR